MATTIISNGVVVTHDSGGKKVKYCGYCLRVKISDIWRVPAEGLWKVWRRRRIELEIAACPECEASACARDEAASPRVLADAV